MAGFSTSTELAKKPAIGRAPQARRPLRRGTLRSNALAESVLATKPPQRGGAVFNATSLCALYTVSTFLEILVMGEKWIFATVTVTSLQSARRDLNRGPPAFLGRAHARHGDCPLLARGRLEASSLASLAVMKRALRHRKNGELRLQA
jgi:hypothetical protein